MAAGNSRGTQREFGGIRSQDEEFGRLRISAAPLAIKGNYRQVKAIKGNEKK